LVNGVVKGAAGGAIGGAASGFAVPLMFGADVDEALDGMWSGAANGAFYGGLTGGMVALNQAKMQKISVFSGERLEGHHTLPRMMLGYDDGQELAPMSQSTHIEIHKDMRKYLDSYGKQHGLDLVPRRGYPGSKMREDIDLPLRFRSIKSFYDNYPFKYYPERKLFYENYKLKWHIYPFKKN
ncbi:MAG: hypothetical protein NC127_06260, partial [Muribaculum sp.]|nr:hypothetical protein [Muribaculum sp.]